MAPPDVTVSVVNHNGRATLLPLLESVAREAEGLAVETVVLDNASEDGAAAEVRARFPGVRVVEQPFRAGFGANHNRVMRETAGRYVFVCSHDAELAPGSLRRLVAFLDARPRAAVAAPRLRYPDGREQASAWRFPTPAASAVGLLTLDRVGIVQSGGDEPRRVDWAMGAALLLRRAALDEVGLFDEGFFMFSEETDLCRRLADAGWETWLVPDAVVVHAESALRAGVPAERIAEEWRSRRRYWAKHHSPAGARAAARLAAARYAARAGIAGAVRRVRPDAFDPGFSDRMLVHARAAWRGPGERGLRELADEWNAAHPAAGGSAGNDEAAGRPAAVEEQVED
jgi:N-acetylglucosaminyl-diphospho-decaprenol L-rhamnosyltransferase